MSSLTLNKGWQKNQGQLVPGGFYCLQFSGIERNTVHAEKCETHIPPLG